MMWNDMMWTAAPWWHWLWMAAFWGVILFVAIWGITRAFPADRSHPPEPSARELLDQRLARGEIDVDDYRRLRQELVASGQDRPT